VETNFKAFWKAVNEMEAVQLAEDFEVEETCDLTTVSA